MGYRDILLHLKTDAPDAEHVRVALRLASAQRARVTGLITQRDIAMVRLLWPETSAIVQDRIATCTAAADAAERRLRHLAADMEVDVDVVTGEGDAAELLGLTGRFHDLVVVEQSAPAEDEAGWDIPEHCVAVTGRPVLVVPSSGSFHTVGRHVLIAWNASREASLAVQHALPLLAQADRVTVLNGAAKEAYPSVTRRPPLDIAAHLRRYVPAVEVVPFDAADAAVGPAILAASRELAADLVVMGAYGRSWFREWIMGGATRHVLRHARVPLLMAH